MPQPDLRYVLEGVVKSDLDDGTHARVADIDGVIEAVGPSFSDPEFKPEPPEIGEFFVRLLSWATRSEHPQMWALDGRKVRVTIETIS